MATLGSRSEGGCYEPAEVGRGWRHPAKETDAITTYGCALNSDRRIAMDGESVLRPGPGARLSTPSAG
jgi:hypothetical protein